MGDDRRKGQRGDDKKCPMMYPLRGKPRMSLEVPDRRIAEALLRETLAGQFFALPARTG